MHQPEWRVYNTQALALLIEPWLDETLSSDHSGFRCPQTRYARTITRPPVMIHLFTKLMLLPARLLNCWRDDFVRISRSESC